MLNTWPELGPIGNIKKDPRINHKKRKPLEKQLASIKFKEQINVKNFIGGEEENTSTNNESVGIITNDSHDSHTLVICASIFLLTTYEIFNINLFLGLEHYSILYIVEETIL